MQKLTPAGKRLVENVSKHYNLSTETVTHILVAVSMGGGSMAQFNSPELGGSGQWMRGGMTMVGDMFNHGLKMTVDNLCTEISDALATGEIFAAIPAGAPGSNHWWPSEYGSPFSSGAQNNIRYAIFSGKLAVERNGQVTVYDTLNHNISGISQQQGGDTSLTFSSQLGTVAVNQLPIISGPGTTAPPVQSNFAESAPPEPVPTAQDIHPTVQTTSLADTPPAQSPSHQPILVLADEIIHLIEKLAKLRDAGALTEEEFNAKKTELLTRL